MDGTRTDDGPLGGLLAPEPPSAARRRRRSALLALLGVVTVALLGAAGWAGTGWLRDRDLRAGLDLSTDAVVRVAGRAVAAQDPQALLDVARAVPAARQQVARARGRAQRTGGERGAAVLAELTAHDAVLAALEPLEGLGTGPLQAWGRARVPLGSALQQEAAARPALRRLAVEQRLAVLDGLGPALDRVAAPLLQQAADTERARVQAVLQGARTTADLREAAEVAGAQRSAVRRTATVTPPGPARLAVLRCVAVLDALAGLTAVSGRDASAWPAARDRLLPTLGGSGVLERVDEVVRVAAAATAQWRVRVVQAQQAREQDAAALASHSASLRGLASPYGGLDARLSALLDTLVAQRVDPAGLTVLADDVAVRERLAGALAALPVPAALAAEHAAVVQTAVQEAAAVRALADALAVQAGLPLLPGSAAAPALPMGSLVDARTAATGARAAALTAWEAAASRAAALVEKRPLPDEPAL